MNERREPMDKESATAPHEDDARGLRFQGIVEHEDGEGEMEPAPRAFRSEPAELDGGAYDGPARRRRPARDWHSMARQTLLVTRVIAVFWVFAILIGWPIGDAWAYWTNQGGSLAGWTFWHAVSLEGFLLAVVASLLTLLVGYIASRLLHTVSAAETIAHAANRLISPDVDAANKASSVGAVIRGQMDALNMGLDQALARLASVEAMIRQHVEAIETAGQSIETQSSGAVGRVADERARLIDLTEHLNAQADAFAAAIAGKAQASIEALHSADDVGERAQAHLEDRLSRLDAAAQSALQSFTALCEALQTADETVRASTGRIEASAEETRRASEQASAIAEAAAEAAGRNAANVGGAALRAAEEAKKAADDSIAMSAQETERASRAAIEATQREVGRIAEALDTVKRTTEAAIASAAEDAAKASGAAEQVSQSARRASEAASKASEDVTQASDAVRRSTDEALAAREEQAKQVEARNKALAEARAALEEENNRLESLIAEQRARADRLADAIATQTERLSKLAEAQIREQEAEALKAEEQAAKETQEREAARAEAAQRRAAQEEADAAERARLAAERAAAEEAEQKRREQEAAKKAAEPEAPSVLDLGEAAKSRPPKPGGPNGSRQRLDELADDIAQRRGPSRDNNQRSGDRRDKQSVSWREILDATDEASPLDLAAASVSPPKSGAPAPSESAARAIAIISELQTFTLDLETRLYGDPPPALRERFGRGDRNVFANRILRLNETDVKRRIRAEAGRDKAFERDVHAFLQSFERLLEDATTSETADEELEEYLSSPLGRVYLLIGATVGYFA